MCSTSFLSLLLLIIWCTVDELLMIQYELIPQFLCTFLALKAWYRSISFKHLVILADNCFVEQHADAAMNLCLLGCLCIFGTQYMNGRHDSFSSSSILHFFFFFLWSWITFVWSIEYFLYVLDSFSSSSSNTLLLGLGLWSLGLNVGLVSWEKARETSKLNWRAGRLVRVHCVDHG